MNRFAPTGLLLAAPAVLIIINSCAAPRTQFSLAAGTYIPADVGTARSKAALFIADHQFALAIEQYRTIMRDKPDDRDAIEGLAIAYNGLQRFDLGDRYYQQALALAPRDAGLYGRYAAALRGQGRADEAATLDHDMQAMLAGAPVDPIARETVQTANADVTRLDQSAIVGLKPPLVIPVPPPSPAAVQSRLVRVSLGEVRLVTTASLASTSFSRPIGILNAARVTGIATRMTGYLHKKGWARLAKGDAPYQLAVSRVIYPPLRRAQAMRLIATTPFKVEAVVSSKADHVQLLLGTNAVAFDARLRDVPPRRTQPA